jgi:hypothetical protein
MSANGGYENAPATRLHCAVCRRPLVDAASVDTGIGPECRKKHGYNIVVDENARREANQLVYQIALEGTEMGHAIGLAQAASRLNELGFEVLSKVLLERACPVRIKEDNGMLSVKSPYSEHATQLFRSVYGRRWDKENKVNTFPVAAKPRLFWALCQAYDGMVALGPKGPFELKAVRS